MVVPAAKFPTKPSPSIVLKVSLKFVAVCCPATQPIRRRIGASIIANRNRYFEKNIDFRFYEKKKHYRFKDFKKVTENHRLFFDKTKIYKN